jgi:hypothetical protein
MYGARSRHYRRQDAKVLDLFACLGGLPSDAGGCAHHRRYFPAPVDRGVLTRLDRANVPLVGTASLS